MAAILQPDVELDLVPGFLPAPSTPVRPALRVIEGGRSPRRMRRVYRRRRAAALVLAVLVALTCLTGLRAAGRALAPDTPAVPAAATSGGARVVVVQPGDTLWSIARRLQPTGDVRPLVDRLAAAHGSAPLVAGDRIPVG